MVTLRIGSTGAEVKELQELLNLAGASLNVDGVFGNDTYNAVISFQAVHDLTIDGIVGPKTWDALYSGNKSLIKLINDCVADIQALPTFKKFMEMITNE